MTDEGAVRGESREVAALVGIQAAITRPRTVKAARGLSYLGEHGLGWFVLGLCAAAVDTHRRRDWMRAATGVIGAHAASVVVKRVVRRARPDDPEITVGVSTPSRLSFPSAHATSTTAAAVLYSGLLRRNLVPVLVPPMLISRLVLGVHYPSDVLAGAVLGGSLGKVLSCRFVEGTRQDE